MRKKNKIIIILFITAILLCLICGIYGLLNARFNSNKNKEYTVQILYYLDEDQKLNEIPKNNEDETLYRYDRYICTNKVKGKWDEEKMDLYSN